MPLDAQAEISDDALLVLFANGDGAAARALTLRLTPLVFSLAQRMLGDAVEAEDVTQEALLRLWKIAPDWRQGEAKVSTWLYRVASNLCTDRLRRRRTVHIDAVAEPEDETPSVQAQMEGRERQDALYTALDDLPERQREAVVLRHIEGLTNPQIAEVMEISVEAVESLTARGKRTLASRLAGLRSKLGL